MLFPVMRGGQGRYVRSVAKPRRGLDRHRASTGHFISFGPLTNLYAGRM